MKTIFEIREKIIQIYNKIDAFVVPVLKLIIAFVILHTINSKFGYFSKIDSVAIELIVSLLCSFLPSGVILIFAALFTILHMYSLSLIVAALGVILYLILYLLLLRFAPKGSVVAAVTPILMMWKIPYILPIILGLVGAPGAAVAMACGVVVYYFLNVVTTNAVTISTMELSQAADQLKLIVDALIANKGMVVIILAFAVTTIAVYFLKRIPVKGNWEIAIGSGVVIDIILLIVGDLIMDTGISFVNVLLVSLLAAAIGFVIKFFRFCVDFGRVERVQFEDDDYYYYVKAVPKINLGVASNRSKNINSPKNGRSRFVTGSTDDMEAGDGYDEGGYEDAGYSDDNYEGEYADDGNAYDNGGYDNNGEYYTDDNGTQSDSDEGSDENDDYEELF